MKMQYKINQLVVIKLSDKKHDQEKRIKRKNKENEDLEERITQKDQTKKDYEDEIIKLER